MLLYYYRKNRNGKEIEKHQGDEIRFRREDMFPELNSSEGEPKAYFFRAIHYENRCFGYTTYEQIVTELSPQYWAYPDQLTYVLTHKKSEDIKKTQDKTNMDKIIFTVEKPENLVDRLRQEEGKDIWLCGGASIINQLLDSDRIDKICLSVIPVILGEGIRLFENREKDLPLKLVKCENNNGMLDILYVRR